MHIHTYIFDWFAVHQSQRCQIKIPKLYFCIKVFGNKIMTKQTVVKTMKSAQSNLNHRFKGKVKNSKVLRRGIIPPIQYFVWHSLLHFLIVKVFYYFAKNGKDDFTFSFRIQFSNYKLR